jgi:hypothetical protein
MLEEIMKTKIMNTDVASSSMIEVKATYQFLVKQGHFIVK